MTNHNSQRMAINARLTDDLAADLDRIMAFHGLESKTEVVRFLIRREARRVAALARPLVPAEKA